MLQELDGALSHRHCVFRHRVILPHRMEALQVGKRIGMPLHPTGRYSRSASVGRHMGNRNF